MSDTTNDPVQQLRDPQAMPQGTCPNCGYCPHCGRGGHHVMPWYPAPQYPQYPQYPWYPVITWSGTSGTM